MKQKLLLSIFALLAVTAAWAGETHFPLYGETSYPYFIRSVADMNLLAQDVNSGTPYEGCFFQLDADLDFSSVPLDATGSNYTPIGTCECPFMGHFSGMGHFITGIVINRTGGSDADEYNGVFGFMYGYVNSLILENSSITGYSSTGGIVGGGGYGMYDCHVGSDVTIHVTDGSGGYVAQNYGGLAGEFFGTIEGCTSAATINAEGKEAVLVGGLVGLYPEGEMNYCLSLSSVNGMFGVGGISGLSEDGAHFKCCGYALPCTAEGAIGAETPHDAAGTYRCDVYDNPPDGFDESDIRGFMFHFVSFPSCEMFFFQGRFYAPSSGGGSGDEPQFGDNWLDNPGYYDTSWYDPGTSTFYLNTPAQLAGLAFLVNQGNTFDGNNIIIVRDLDLGAHYWTPIGNGENPFRGTFQGSNKTISGLFIKRAFNYEEETYSGLFGYMEYGTIGDLVLADSRIVGANNTGGIVGFLSSGSVTNCCVKSSVSISACVNNPSQFGGIVGYGSGAYLDGCVNAATLTNDYEGENFGGIIGYFSYGRLTNCLNLGALNCPQSSYIGGLIGYGERDCINCFYGGACTTGAVKGVDYEGAMKASEATTAPSNLGNTVSRYSLGLLAYENGLLFEGTYYYDETVKASAFPIYAGDEGTGSAPFQIKTPQDLMALAEEVNGGRDFEFTYFLLANDIDFSDMPLDEEGSNYTPIGTPEKPFNGIFRGNGKTIRGVRINKTGQTEADQYNGLFGYIGGPRGVVQDLTLADSRIAGYHYTGGIAGGSLWKIVNCHVLADVTICAGSNGAACLGGIVGKNDSSRSSIHGYVIGCTSAATICGGDFSAGLSYGGIAGACENPRTYNYPATIEDCLSIANVLDSSRKGTILGYNAKGTDTSNITHCFYSSPSQGIPVGDVNSSYYPVEGATMVFPYANDPGVMGEQLAEPVYTSFENAPGLIFYENGVFYDGIYYTSKKSAIDVTFSKTGYATIFDSRYKIQLPYGQPMKAYIVTLDADGQMGYQCVADGLREEIETYEVPAGTAVLLYNPNAVGVEDEAERTMELGRWFPGDYDPTYPANILRGSDKDALTTGGTTYYKIGERGSTFGWIWGAEGGAAFLNPANNAYLPLDVENPVNFIDLSSDGPDGIESLTPTLSKGERAIYNVAGQRLNAMQRGINIVKGKKILK